MAGSARQKEELMHWLHVNPNSDFCSHLEDFLPKKYWKLWHLSLFWQIICTWQTFSIFWAKFWHMFGKKEVFGKLFELSFFGFFLNSGQFLEKNLTKIGRKSAEKSKNWNSDLGVANA